MHIHVFLIPKQFNLPGRHLFLSQSGRFSKHLTEKIMNSSKVMKATNKHPRKSLNDFVLFYYST